MSKQKYKFMLSIDVRSISALLDAYEVEKNVISEPLKAQMNSILRKVYNKIEASSEVDKDKEASELNNRIINVINNRKPCSGCHKYHDDLFQIKTKSGRFNSKYLCSKCLQEAYLSNNIEGIYRVHNNSYMKTRKIVDKNYDYYNSYDYYASNEKITQIYTLVKKHGIENIERLLSNLDFASMSLANKGVDAKLSSDVYFYTKKEYFEYQKETLDKPLFNPRVQEFFLKHYLKILSQNSIFPGENAMRPLFEDYREICETHLNNKQKELSIEGNC